MGWREVSDDPNARVLLDRRQSVVDAVAAPPLPNRAGRILELCRDRKVVDVGCVDHRAELRDDPSWLHGRIAQIASSCLGVDVEEEGVAAMRAAGFDAVAHDVCQGPGPVGAYAPFDVVVAGEVVEHLAAPQTLFEFASAVLAPGGRLVLTTPNPYAPHRTRAGQLGVAWENVDHVVYAFPSGIAELGARTGLELEEYRTVFTRPLRRELRRGVVRLVLGARDRVLRAHHRDSHGGDRMLDALTAYVNPFELAFVAATRSRRFLGETALYVLRKPGADSP